MKFGVRTAALTIATVTAVVALISPVSADECSMCAAACAIPSDESAVHVVSGDTCASTSPSAFACPSSPVPAGGIRGSWFTWTVSANSRLQLHANPSNASLLSEGGIRVRVFLACGGGGKSAKCEVSGVATEATPLTYIASDAQKTTTVLIFVSGECSHSGNNCTCGAFELSVSVAKHKEPPQTIAFVLCGVIGGIALVAGTFAVVMKYRKRRHYDLTTKYTQIQ